MQLQIIFYQMIDPFPLYSSSADCDGESDGVGAEASGIASSSCKNDTSVVENHTDVSEEEGWITIPYSTFS